MTLCLKGKLDEEVTAELEQCLRDARSAHLRIYIDLSEVTLMDREAARYLGHNLADVRYINCPGYLRRWIREERPDRETVKNARRDS